MSMVVNWTKIWQNTLGGFLARIKIYYSPISKILLPRNSSSHTYWYLGTLPFHSALCSWIDKWFEFPFRLSKPRMFGGLWGCIALHMQLWDEKLTAHWPLSANRWNQSFRGHATTWHIAMCYRGWVGGYGAYRLHDRKQLYKWPFVL